MRLACGPYYNSLFKADGEPDFNIIPPDHLRALNYEWSFAYYRWHPLVQPFYYSNGNGPNGLVEHPLFSRTVTPNFNGFTPLVPDIELDFGMFWPWSGYNGFQNTQRFGTMENFTLGNLPNPVVKDQTVNLAERSLLRQNQTFMANGQDFARLFGIPESQIIRNKAYPLAERMSEYDSL